MRIDCRRGRAVIGAITAAVLAVTMAEPVSAAKAPPLCGAAFAPNDGESYQQAFQRTDQTFGGLAMARVFYSGLPQAWPGKLDTGGRPISVSFKAGPQDVLAGVHDKALIRWFKTAPQDRDTWWTYFHEPEDDVMSGAYTAAEFRAAFRRVAELAAQAGNPRLHATLILMQYTLKPAAQRDWRQFYPGRDVVDVLGWDAYNGLRDVNLYESPESMFSTIVEISAAEGLPFAVAEMGSPVVAGDSGTGRAAWPRDVTRYLTEHSAVFASYFNQARPNEPVWRLDDAPSQQAWIDFCG
jgi:hypothetical protein